MKKNIFFFVCIALLLGACKKEQSADAPEKEPSAVAFEVDGEQLTADGNGDDVNQCSMYSFGGYAGNYFGVRTQFNIGDNVQLEIVFGTALTKSTTLSEEDFIQLIAPGQRVYGSLGSFSSDPELESGKVEIAYTDKKDKRWCTTEISEVTTPNGSQTRVKVNQKQSKFQVEDIEPVTLNNNAPGYRVKGTFDCVVFEVNGHARKKMKGKFAGVLTRQQY